MVGGVSPKKAGTTHLGLPVFGTVQQVCKKKTKSVTIVAVTCQS